MAERALHDCPKCGQLAPLVPSVFYDLWGIILTEQSHHKGAKDTWVSNRPSNEMEVDDTKAPYKKTIY